MQRLLGIGRGERRPWAESGGHQDHDITSGSNSKHETLRAALAFRAGCQYLVPFLVVGADAFSQSWICTATLHRPTNKHALHAPKTHSTSKYNSL